LGADVQVTTGTKRAGLALIAEAAGAAALVVTLTATVSAQSGSDFLNNTNPLFAGVLARPGNLDNTIQYAASAAAQGDIESAISTYEQLRFYNPKLGVTRYQLGVLYYQLGSYAQARGYLQTALEMPDVTPELRQKIEDLLALADKKLQPDQFFGFAPALSEQCRPRPRIADRARVRRNDQQQLSFPAGLELVRYCRRQLRPRFPKPDRRNFRSFGHRL